jgi:tripartite-type tricarboxylate transporter receptor subunit TctC
MKRVLTAIAAVSCVFVGAEAGAQSWPAKALKAVVPFAAGSSTDIVPRVVFEQLSTARPDYRRGKSNRRRRNDRSRVGGQVGA